MKQGSNQRRSRGRNNNGGGARRGSRNNSFESNGPEVKVRGSAQQVLDKYLQLARDSQSGGDRVKAESYLQFAEHYFRVVNVDQESGDKNVKRSPDQNGGRNGEQHEPREPREQREPRDQREPRRGPRPRHVNSQTQIPIKNEATLAAEAAAANEFAAKEAATNSNSTNGVVNDQPANVPATNNDDVRDQKPKAKPKSAPRKRASAPTKKQEAAKETVVGE